MRNIVLTGSGKLSKMSVDRREQRRKVTEKKINQLRGLCVERIPPTRSEQPLLARWPKLVPITICIVHPGYDPDHSEESIRNFHYFFIRYHNNKKSTYPRYRPSTQVGLTELQSHGVQRHYLFHVLQSCGPNSVNTALESQTQPQTTDTFLSYYLDLWPFKNTAKSTFVPSLVAWAWFTVKLSSRTSFGVGKKISSKT